MLLRKLRGYLRAHSIGPTQAPFHASTAVIASLPVWVAYALMTSHLPDLWLPSDLQFC